MKIFAVNLTCDRDNDLELLMARTLEKHCSNCQTLLSLNTDGTPYGNGAGWEASMMKLNAVKQLLNEEQIFDDDFVLSVDSDVVFTSPEVFKYVSPVHGIIGIKHNPEFSTMMGKWSHMSGALIFIRGDIAKKMAAMSEEELNLIRFQCFKPFDITENEDVVLSYLASYVGARQFDIGSLGFSSGDFESELEHAKFVHVHAQAEWHFEGEIKGLKSFYHLNYCPTQFLGEPVTGKWDIPRILKQKGIEL